MTTESGPIHMHVDRGVMVLAINRPQARNALDVATAQALAARIRDPGEGVRAIVITGTGSAFCSGGDLAYLRDVVKHGSLKATDTIYDNFHALIRTMLASKLPLVAAINGPALGAGLDLALACDLRVGAASATLASSWIRLGLTTGMGGSWLLARAIGGTRAAEMLLLGESISAERAEQIGLINRVAPDEGLMDAVLEMARKLTGLSARGLWATRASLRRALDSGLDSELQLLGSVQGTLLASEEFGQAVENFLAPKR